MKHLFILILFTILSIPAVFAQKIDNLSSFRDPESDHYLRFNYDNDLFMGMDENYTQGFSIEYVAPFLIKNPLNYLFFQPKNEAKKFGLLVEHNSFTPENYFLPEIQFDDRPFAATVVLESFMISINPGKTRRFTSSFAMGLIGSAAFGKEMQVAVHEVVNSASPLGWDNQIKDDLLLNYELGFEKQLYRLNNTFAIHTNVNGRVGTLYTNGSLGFNMQLGVLNSPFSSINENRDFNLYFYAQPLLNIIGYDATMQGGLFNIESVYTISSADIERFTTQLNYGLVLKTQSFYFEFSGSVISKEFQTGSPAMWAGFRVGALF